MSRALISRTFVLIALAAVFVLRSDSRGDGPSPTQKPTSGSAAKPRIDAPAERAAPDAQSTTETAVQHALAEPADFHFVDAPLKEVSDYIANRYKIGVLLDLKALTDAGVTADTTITETIKGVSLRSALRLMLRQKDLAFVTVSTNAVMITTADVAKSALMPRMYVVRDLIAPERLQNEFMKPTSDPGDVAENLIELITSTVSPASWGSNGGNGSIVFLDGALVVSQTEEMHRQIATLLSDLRAVRDWQAKHANDASANSRIDAGPAEQRIRKALDAPLDFSFVETPLKDIADSLRSKLSVPIQLDIKSLTDAGVTLDTTISFVAKQVRAREGLRQLLAEKELTFVIEDESLVITTADRAKLAVHPVVYGVGDLCGIYDPASIGGPDFDSLIEMLTSIIAPMSWDVNGGAGSVAPMPIANAIVCNQTDEIQDQISKLLAQLRANGCYLSEAPATDRNLMVVRIYKFQPTAPNAPRDEQGSRQLIELIRKLIEPKSWADSSATIGEAPGAIVVRQTPLVQYRIEDFLRIFGATAYPPPQSRVGGLTSYAPPTEKARRNKTPSAPAAVPRSDGPAPAGTKR